MTAESKQRSRCNIAGICTEGNSFYNIRRTTNAAADNKMKRVYVNEEWCHGCHLCEYNCAFANSGMTDMATALKGKP